MKFAESNEQAMVVRYLQVKHPKVLFTSSIAGVKVSMLTMSALKRAGYSKGTPDLMIFEPAGKYHGLFIEMKTAKTIYTAKGRPSPEQKLWQEMLKKRGYAAHICYGYEEAISVIDDYLSRRGE